MACPDEIKRLRDKIDKEKERSDLLDQQIA